MGQPMWATPGPELLLTFWAGSSQSFPEEGSVAADVGSVCVQSSLVLGLWPLCQDWVSR